MAATTYAPTKRYTTPFGADRGQPAYGPWPDDKGFLGKTRDATTGLTHIGAREYDPATGQFISVDPLLELDKHQTLNGYSYAVQNPLTHSAPSGMGLACGRGGDACPDDGDPMPESPGSPGNGLNYGDHRGSDGPAPPYTGAPDGGGTANTNSSGHTSPADPLASTEDRVYNKEEPTDRDRDVRGQMYWVLTGTWFQNWDNAYDLLYHWLGTSGEAYEVDPEAMLRDIPQFRGDVANHIDKVKANGDATFDSGWQKTRADEEDGESSLDWYYALNNFQYRVTGSSQRKYGLSYAVQVRKRYDWGVPSKRRNDLKESFLYVDVDVKQAEVAHLHTTGLAQDFDVYGSSTMRGMP